MHPDLETEIATVTINVGMPDPADLVGTFFDATPDHIALGQTDIHFEITNQGSTDAASFDVEFLWSDDDIIGNADDQVVASTNILGLSAGDSFAGTISVELDRAELFSRSVRDNAPGAMGTFNSTEADLLGINIDPANAVIESEEANNFGQDKNVFTDDVTYFPWDTNRSGFVTPTDALYVINRLSGTDSLADLDGNGVVSPSDAIAAINRLGYVANSSVIETTLASNIQVRSAKKATRPGSVLDERAISDIALDVRRVWDEVEIAR